MILALLVLQRRRARRRERRAILAELDRCIARAGEDRAALAAELSQFLRRMALREQPGAAALRDEAWLAWLDTRVRGTEFSRGLGRILADAPFRAAPAFDAPALVALVRRWTREALDNEAANA